MTEVLLLDKEVVIHEPKRPPQPDFPAEPHFNVVPERQPYSTCQPINRNSPACDPGGVPILRASGGKVELALRLHPKIVVNVPSLTSLLRNRKSLIAKPAAGIHLLQSLWCPSRRL